MKKPLTLIFVFCFLVFGFVHISLGQQRQVRTAGSASAELSNREQEGLKGPVRRVRVETSKMMVKGGNFLEGPRVVRGIVTYDPSGKKIDAVDYPVESSSLPGNERYRYDDKGNIVEMVVVGTDGSILSKEAYEYEFDQLGNWTKMATSIAVYENGKVILNRQKSPSAPLAITIIRQLKNSALLRPNRRVWWPVPSHLVWTP